MTSQCDSAGYLYYKHLTDSLLNFKLEAGINNDQIKSINFTDSSRQINAVELQINSDLKQSDSDKLVNPIYWSASSLFIGIFYLNLLITNIKRENLINILNRQ